MFCANNKWCCNEDTCCSNNHGLNYLELGGRPSVTATAGIYSTSTSRSTSTSSTTSTASTSSTTTISSAVSTTVPLNTIATDAPASDSPTPIAGDSGSGSSSDNSGVKIGVGVAVPLAALLLGVSAFLLWRARRRKQSRQQSTYQSIHLEAQETAMDRLWPKVNLQHSPDTVYKLPPQAPTELSSEPLEGSVVHELGTNR